MTILNTCAETKHVDLCVQFIVYKLINHVAKAVKCGYVYSLATSTDSHQDDDHSLIRQLKHGLWLKCKMKIDCIHCAVVSCDL